MDEIRGVWFWFTLIVLDVLGDAEIIDGKLTADCFVKVDFAVAGEEEIVLELVFGVCLTVAGRGVKVRISFGGVVNMDDSVVLEVLDLE